jgi:hypothetical protein
MLPPHLHIVQPLQVTVRHPPVTVLLPQDTAPHLQVTALHPLHTPQAVHDILHPAHLTVPPPQATGKLGPFLFFSHWCYWLRIWCFQTWFVLACEYLLWELSIGLMVWMLLLTSLVMQFLSCTVSFLFWQLLIAFYISTHTVLILIVLSHVIYKHEYLICTCVCWMQPYITIILPIISFVLAYQPCLHSWITFVLSHKVCEHFEPKPVLKLACVFFLFLLQVSLKSFPYIEWHLPSCLQSGIHTWKPGLQSHLPTLQVMNLLHHFLHSSLLHTDKVESVVVSCKLSCVLWQGLRSLSNMDKNKNH